MVRVRPIVFFDGVCGLCNGFIQFVLAVDRTAVFQIATLQGTTAVNLLGLDASAPLATVIVRADSGKLLTRSNAVIYIFRQVGGIWAAVAMVGRWIPERVRDWCYDVVAANRFRLFGKLSTCRMPTPSERGRFLD